MAPVRTSSRRNQQNQNASARPTVPDNNDAVVNDQLFLEPMMGTPLAVYIEKDVEDRDSLVDIILKHGGAISPSYSGVPYILVDPHKESGQNLYRQYAGKKGKIVLSARWVHECVKGGVLQTFHSNWAGCKVLGTEQVGPVTPQTATPTIQDAHNDSSRRQSRQPPPPQADNIPHQIQPAQTMHSHPQAIGPITGGPVDQMVHTQNSFPYQVYATPLHPGAGGMHPPTAGPPQTWQGPNSIAPQQTHIGPPPQMLPRPPHEFRDDAWNGSYDPTSQTPNPIVAGPSAPGYDYRYRDDQPNWVGGPNDYYDPSQQFNQPYDPSVQFIPEAGPSTAGPSTVPPTEAPEKTRGRKRTRTQPTPVAPASTLVMSRRHPPARSPTPPSRVIKSTYGGNLFTAEDVLYLKKYIDYCQEQGLVLSLREICERIAVKAPHHTFYSWRRYCNKHQIRLGGYAMGAEDPEGGEPDQEEEQRTGPGPGTIATARQRIRDEGDQPPRTRSPTPPRALFRSTTGKGVAFTEEDVTFLVRFMQYRKSQGRIDMVAFWKDVASKAPHHSRASWMKFWRRHKHELERTDGDDPLPTAPEKKMRYSREDDVLLAKYFHERPDGTSDKIFQAFGRLNPHHPWKGWQEHHRIHKAKIDHLIQQLVNGENIDIQESQ